MKKLLFNIKLVLFLFVMLSVILMTGVVIQQRRSQTYLMSAQNSNKRSLRSQYAKAGKIISRDQKVLAESKNGERLYAADPAVAATLLHLVGDYTHNIGNTLESAYQAELCGTDRSPVKQLLYDLRGIEGGDNLRLTVDAGLSTAIAGIMGQVKGAAVILNYKTGELIASVSLPSTAPENVLAWKNIPESSLFNRVLVSAYAPGSTFKIVTSTAWLKTKNFDPDLIVQCRAGEGLLGQGSVNEERADAGHGPVNFDQAMAQSCNHFFGHVAVLSGTNALVSQAEQFAFNQSFTLDKLWVRPSRMSLPPGDDFLLSWMAIGQAIDKAELNVSPLHLAMIAGSVAANGTMMTPHVVQTVLGPKQEQIYQATPKILRSVMEPVSAARIREAMQFTVEQGMARSAKIPGLLVGGKTGTAQYTAADGSIKNNSLFCGFIADESKPYAIAMVIEDQMLDISALAGKSLALAAGIPKGY